MTDNERTVVEFVMARARDMMRAPVGALKYPFLHPGAGYYDELWDWDSYFTLYALRDMLEIGKNHPAFDYEAQRELLGVHARGCILNFLGAQREDGFVPIVLKGRPCAEYDARYRNTHKPFLAKNALLASEISSGIDWLDFDGLRRYFDYYRSEQYDEASGLYFWADDRMIGIDNNPACFGRPEGSCADVYLNVFMVGEFRAFSELLKMRGDEALSEEYELRAQALCASIEREIWDEYTDFYYPQDLLTRLRSDKWFHRGMKIRWKSFPLKIKSWAGFLPLLYGIASSERAEKMKRHLSESAFAAPYGIRTLANDEKMYDLSATSNPSNWLGAIWTVANFCVFEGLAGYGMKKEALALAESTMAYLAEDIRRNGNTSESYHPDTGRPFLHSGFLNWNCLAVSMYRRTEEGLRKDQNSLTGR